MQTAIRRAARHIRNVIRPDSVRHRGITIPAKYLRFGGENFLDNETFLSSGEKEAKRLRKDFGLTTESAVLEIGCGTGRLPIGILSIIGEIQTYRGVDVSDTAIDWCKRRIEKHHPHFQFRRINIHNERYNPKGTESIELPFPDQSFDIIYLYSVFSHMKAPDIKAYLSEFKRLLKLTGHVFLTAFIEENVPEIEENPEGYKQSWKGALHCVRYEKGFFEKMLSEHGFGIEKLEHGTETDGQSAITLSKTSHIV